MRPLTLLSSAVLLATASALPQPSTSYLSLRQTYSTPFDLPSSSSEKVGYLLTTFPVEDEAVYMYLSSHNDPHTWRQLTLNGNGSAPEGAILRSTIGDQGVRDSHIVPAVDGSKFWLIATDLQVNNKPDFNVASRFGSRSIVIWESTDLVNWSGPRLTCPLVDVSAGNVWAPEANWSPEDQAYIVVFASRFFPAEPADRSGPQPDNKLMYVTTTDFETFSEEKEYIAPGYPVIDATFMRAEEEGEGVWYRWVKDERDLLIYQERSETGLLGAWRRVGGAPDDERITFAKEYSNNEGPLIFRDNLDSELFHLWIDENDLQTYIPATARTLNDMSAWKAEELKGGFPNHVKHGSVTSVTQAQYEGLLERYAVVEASVHG